MYGAAQPPLSIAFLSWVGPLGQGHPDFGQSSSCLRASSVFMAVTFSSIFNEFVLLLLAHHLCFSLTGSHFMFGDITEEL